MHEGIGLELLRENSFNIVGIFSDDEISECQISQNSVPFSNEFVEQFEFWFVFLNNSSFGSFMIFVEEKGLYCTWDLLENRKDAINLGTVMCILAK